MGQVGVVQIFVQLRKGLVHGLSQKIDLRGDGEGLGHAELSGAGPLRAAGGVAVLFLHQDQIPDVGLGADDAALDEQVALMVRQGADGALQPHGNDADGFAQSDLRGLQAGRGRSFLLHGKLTVLLRDLISYLLPLLFQILHGSAGAGLLEDADGFVRRILGLLQDLAGLFVGLPEDLITGLVDALLLLLQPPFQRLDLPFIGFDLLLLLFNGHAALLQVGKQILKAFVLRADLGGGRFDDLLGKAKPPGNGEGVALSGYADEQPVGGPQGLHVKFAAGVFHKGGGKGVNLQLAVMGGRHGAHAPVVQVVQDGDGKGRALRGIGSGSQLVEEAEGVRVRVLQDGHDAGHVGGEGAQALLDALLVPDIRKNLPEHGKLRPVLGRDMKAGLSHQAEQSRGFQGNRFSARIRPGDDEKVIIPAQTDIDGNGFLFIQ